MTTIVLNLATLAVTEYDWTFRALCETHAGSDAGLFALGGDDDAGVPIDASFATGVTLRDGSLKNGIDGVYFTMTADPGALGQLVVYGQQESWSYPFEVDPDGVSRGVAGKGIRENLLGFGFQNLDGADFAITRMEVRTTQSKQRRI